jgi:hypothetical protein
MMATTPTSTRQPLAASARSPPDGERRQRDAHVRLPHDRAAGQDRDQGQPEGQHDQCFEHSLEPPMGGLTGDRESSLGMTLERLSVSHRALPRCRV